MREYTYILEVVGEPGDIVEPGLDELEDLYEALVEDPAVLGPVVGVNLEARALEITMTVEAEGPDDGRLAAIAALHRALAATRLVPLRVEAEALPTTC